ncbi:MAG: YqaJ viral recombinase family protein [Lachnospiraceae bacterium]|nr:YqaJ viral recombinase family protein [Lachnospiraceae bacterium]
MSKILVKTADLPRDEWLEYRRTGIGGSDAAAVCGLHPYKSLIELWADKTGRLPEQEDNEAMRTGRDLEEYVASRFCEATGKKVRRRNAIFKHDKYDFITANIDREIVGENAGLECKTTSAFAKSDFENGEIPLYYLVQCRHYMNVMGYDKMYLAVLVMGRAFYWYEIPYDKTEGEALLQMEVAFWEKNVIPDARPEPDGSESAERTLKAVFDEQLDDTMACYEMDAIAAHLVDIKAQIGELKAQEETLKQQMITALEGCERGFTSEYDFSWKEQKRRTVDAKALKAKYPKIYEELAKESSTRVFRIRDRKES